MEISHAIRGEEWLPSAPAHILIYRYLGWETSMPQYAHLPLLLKPDGNGKLSKRDGDRLGFPVFPLDWQDPNTGEKSSGYRERGYYPEAFVNMLAFLGWNPGTEQELFTMEELIQHFSFEHVHKAGARFDPEKAKWFNEQYLRKQTTEALANRLQPVVKSKFNLAADDVKISSNYLVKAVALLKDRVQFESELIEKGSYLFQVPDVYDEQVLAKKWKPELASFFNALIENLKSLEEFNSVAVDAAIKSTAATSGIKPGEIMQLLRVFVSGQGAGVDLIGMLELFGKNEVIARLNKALQKVN
jgi:glutamyl-tRNA synthetase